MHRKTRYGIAVAVLVVCGLAESAAAYYSSRQGRFLNRDPIGEQGGLNLYSHTRNSPPARYDPLGQDDQPDPGPLSGGWTRKLVGGPFGIDGKLPGYSINIKHVLPALPERATQVWQVVGCIVVWLDNTCLPKAMFRTKTDIVDIGERKEVNDKLAFHFPTSIERSICFASEICFAKVGFDDGTRRAEQTSVDAEDLLPDFVNDLIDDMRSPGYYATAYTFVKKKKCCACIRDWMGKINVPDGEWLTVGGVGSWSGGGEP